jgi:hypothetical protein
MKTIFDIATREELIRRIKTLNKNSQAQWGKMTVYQMAKHCSFWDQWVLGRSNLPYKQILLGKIFGKWALKSNVKDDTPMKKNMPASRPFIVKDQQGDIEVQKEIWIKGISGYENYSNPEFIHDFFGKMTVQEIGIFAYKHADHHLRQFKA